MKRTSNRTPLKSGFLTIRTINVRGIRQIVKNWYNEIKSFKTKWDKRIVEKKYEEDNEEQAKESVKNKGTILLYWIDQNRNSIIILTETKLSCKEDVFDFNYKVGKATNKSFWIYYNYFKEKSKHGVITLIPKKLFSKQNHKVLKEGMINESKFPLKGENNSVITLISYYNLNPSRNTNLCKMVLEKNTLIKKVIIAGDFNQITDVNVDVKRVKEEHPNKQTHSRNLRKAKFFETLIKD